MTANNVSTWLQTAARLLSPISEMPNLEAQLILASSLDKPRYWVLAHPEEPLPEQISLSADELVSQRVAGEPLPYLLGHQEFFGLDFIVTRDVLIPRPETEMMVEIALDWLKTQPGQQFVADVGTGSGCIAVSLAVNNAQCSLTATDCSSAALDVARRNAARHAVYNRLQFVESNLLTAVNHPLDLVCANLPYIPTDTLARLEVGRHEPRQALDGGVQGLDLIHQLLEDLPRLITPGGLILLEIEATQGESVPALAAAVFPNASVQLHQDLAGHPRLVQVQLQE